MRAALLASSALIAAPVLAHAQNATWLSNAGSGNCRQLVVQSDFIQYIIDWPDGQLIVRRPPTEMFEEGAAVAISFAAEHCVLLEG